MNMRQAFSACILSGIMATALSAQDRATVLFEVQQPTSVGQSVYVLGDLPELGNNDVTRALKLEPSAYPLWRATVSVPTNRPYTYRYYLRADAPAQQRTATNGTPVGAPLNGFQPAPLRQVTSKTIIFRSTWAAPQLFWRQDGGTYTQTQMLPFGEGRLASERTWIAPQLGSAPKPIEFYILPASGSGREPSSGTYLTSPDAIIIQDSQIYTYSPAASVAAQQRDYTPSSPPAIASTNLSESRRYRVLLPRGYASHPERRYPVIYMHDGQNVFESGPFGSWFADVAAAAQVRTGTMRECIIVGADNTSNRFTDYIPPQDGGRADRYVRFLRDELKPIIDAQYRTLPGPATTGAIGSSLGGVVSLYMGWDYTTVYTRLGVLSGAWQATQIDARAANETKRTVRIWLDSGDSGTSDDNYWSTYGLRDSLIRPAHTGGPYGIGGDLFHMVGFNHQHNEPAWAARIGPAFSYLFPASEELSPFLPIATLTAFDTTGDTNITIDDLYAFEATPRDVNVSGDVTPGDTQAMRSILRRGERTDILQNRL